jgi:hypothetical protein
MWEKLWRNNIPLRFGAAVVVQSRFGSRRVGLVIVEVGSQGVVASVELGACSLVVTRQNHVRNLGGDGVHPLLPQIPVGLVQNRHITALRSTLVGDLTGRQWCVEVLSGVGRTTRKSGGAAVVTDRPGALTGQDTTVPIVGVRNITSMPGKSETILNSVAKVLVSSMSVGVTHVVQHSDSEFRTITRGVCSSEA